MIEPGEAVDRLEHQIAGIQRHDDLMIALGAKFLADQLAMARRMLPVDEAAVEPRRIFAQRLELGALAFLQLRLDAVDRFLDKKLQGGAVNAAHVRQHVDGAIDRNLAHELNQRERALPAQPNPIDEDASATARHDRQAEPRREGKGGGTVTRQETACGRWVWGRV